MIHKPRHIPKLSWLPLRHRAEEAAASLPDLIVTAEKAAASILSGDHRQRKPGSGERFWQYREYDPGDRPQDIDWRQSAKGDRVFVRQKEWQTTQTVLFWLQGDKGMDYHSSPSLPPKRVEGIVLALALSLLLTRRGELCGMLNDTGHRPGRSAPSLQRLGEDLLRVPEDKLPHPAMSNLPPNVSVVLIGDFLGDIQETRRMMDVLAARAPNGILIQVLDPTELALPFKGRMIFEMPDASEDHHILNVESVRDAYTARMRDHMEALQLMCRRHRWHWMLHPTNRDMKETLFDLWRIIGDDGSHRKDGSP